MRTLFNKVISQTFTHESHQLGCSNTSWCDATYSILAASPHTQPPVELFPQQVPLFADSLQHGAILLGPAQQIRERVVYGAVWH